MYGYSMEELLPVAAKLTERYTAGRSTSVTYEKACQMMEAVLYCIRQGQGENQMTGPEKLSAEKAWRYGYEKTVEKVKRTQERTARLLQKFCSYGNENCRDTVTKALPGFFRFYDAMFAPQETIITMDYPVLRPIKSMTGIDAVAVYVDCICLEQEFMGNLPEDYVTGVLRRFQPGYRKQMYNLCEILLRHLLGCLLVGKKGGTQQGYDRLKELVDGCGQAELERHLKMLLQQLIIRKYDGNQELYTYLEHDVEDFAVRLKLGAQQHQLPRILVL